MKRLGIFTMSKAAQRSSTLHSQWATVQVWVTVPRSKLGFFLSSEISKDGGFWFFCLLLWEFKLTAGVGTHRKQKQESGTAQHWIVIRICFHC